MIRSIGKLYYHKEENLRREALSTTSEYLYIHMLASLSNAQMSASHVALQLYHTQLGYSTDILYCSSTLCILSLSPSSYAPLHHMHVSPSTFVILVQQHAGVVPSLHSRVLTRHNLTRSRIVPPYKRIP